jgi:hypothetical protein
MMHYIDEWVAAATEERVATATKGRIAAENRGLMQEAQIQDLMKRLAAMEERNSTRNSSRIRLEISQGAEVAKVDIETQKIGTWRRERI